MLHFPPDPKGRTVGFVINLNVYNNKDFIKKTVISRLKTLGIDDIVDTFISIAAYQRADNKKATKKMLEPYIMELLEFSDMQGIETILVANSAYFTFLTGLKYEASVGVAPKCIIKDYEHITIMPIINPVILKMQPTKKALLELSFYTASQVLKGVHVDAKFEFETYKFINTAEEAEIVLKDLAKRGKLAWDIETTGLHHIRNELVTQSLAPSENEAYTFVMHEKFLGKAQARKMHNLFKKFFRDNHNSIIVHNLGFESKFLMSKYIMDDYKDYAGMYNYLNRLKWDDTMLMGYALFNSTERIELDLKSMARHKYGDWDADINIKDAINQPIDKLAYYNAIDVSATYYLYNSLSEKLKDKQREFYETEMKATQQTFTKIMCTGIPIDMDAVLKGEKILIARLEKLNDVFYKNPYILEATSDLHHKLAKKYNDNHKVKQVTAEYFEDIKFNPKSNLQLQDLLFDNMGYTPTEFTKSKAPSTKREVLESFMTLNRTDDTMREVLETLVGFSETSIILDTFISSFKNDSVEVAPGKYRLYGNLRVGGTISFRPTASNPNLLNAPSGSVYGGIIKSCFKANDGFIIGTSDHASLQGRSGGNLTNDKALIKIYNEDVDLHSYMTVRYWKEKFDADHPETAEWYDWVKENYKKLRDKSKGITFACQFGGGPAKIAKMLGVPLEEGRRIWKAYHDTYSGVAAFGKVALKFAETHGYMELGMGLRLQTPTITRKAKAVVRNLREEFDRENAIMQRAIRYGQPYTAPMVSEKEVIAAEAKLGGDERSAVNACTQFYDYLTLQGLEKFYRRIHEAGYEDIVIPHATIYDSIYMEIKNDPETIKWANENLIECMIEEYMENQPIQLVANMDIGITWKDCKELPNNCEIDRIKYILRIFDLLSDLPEQSQKIVRGYFLDGLSIDKLVNKLDLPKDVITKCVDTSIIELDKLSKL